MGRTKQTYDPAKGNAEFIAAHDRVTSMPDGPERKQAARAALKTIKPSSPSKLVLDLVCIGYPTTDTALWRDHLDGDKTRSLAGSMGRHMRCCPPEVAALIHDCLVTGSTEPSSLPGCFYVIEDRATAFEGDEHILDDAAGPCEHKQKRVRLLAFLCGRLQPHDSFEAIGGDEPDCVTGTIAEMADRFGCAAQDARAIRSACRRHHAGRAGKKARQLIGKCSQPRRKLLQAVARPAQNGSIDDDAVFDLVSHSTEVPEDGIVAEAIMDAAAHAQRWQRDQDHRAIAQAQSDSGSAEY